jgi:outer membrane protein OmpA-like peptidoglycan-associated protein
MLIPKYWSRASLALIRYGFLFPVLLCMICSVLPAQSLFDSLYDVRTLEIHFASGKAELSTSSKLALDSLLDNFKGISTEKTVRITAHTDAVGNTAFNEKLSVQRAESVAQWLLSNGLPERSIISVSALGERAPVQSNDTEEGRLRNRRATVEVARKVQMALLEGRVTDKSTGQGIETTVSFRSKTRQDSARTDSSGRYSVRLPKDSVVKIEVIEKNYFFESVTLKIMGSPELYKQYKVSPDIVLPPARPGETVILRNFYFIGGEARLVKASEPELPKILKFMQLNPDLNIEIGGHINVPYDEKHGYPLKPGQTAAEYVMAKRESWEQELSGKRAELVLHYLLKNGIPASRMTTKGYKNSKMLYPFLASSDLQQQMNRRVEIKITGRTGH